MRLPLSADAPDRLATFLWGAAAVVAAVSCGFWIVPGSDLWWHLAAGRWIVDHRALVFVDPGWSYTAAGRSWVHDAWLSDVVFELWRRIGGMSSLAFWKWTVIGATAALLYRTLHRITDHAPAAFAVAAAAIWVPAPFLDVRPHLYSLAGLALVLFLTAGRERPSWALPVVFLFWANLHPIALLGWVVLAILIAGRAIAGRIGGREAERPERRAAGRGEGRARSWAILGLSGAALLVNPRGIGIVERPVRYALTSSVYRGIAEWRSPFQEGGQPAPLYPYLVAVFAACALAGLAFSLRSRSTGAEGPGERPNARRGEQIAVLVGVLTLAASLRSRRFIPFFAIASTVSIAPVLARLVPRPRGRHAAALAAVALALCALRLAQHPLRARTFTFLVAEDSFPVETLNYANAAGVKGNLFAYYNWGGYVHERTGGRLRVFIDGRADMVYDEETYRSYLQVLFQRPGWITVVEDGRAELVLWPKTMPEVPETLLQTGRWRVQFEDAVSVLLIRADLPELRDVDTPDGPWRDLRLGSVALDLGRYDEAAESFRAALARAPHMLAACDGLEHALARGAAPRDPDVARIARCRSSI